MRDLASQLRWLIGIRLVVITSVVLPYFLLQLSSSASAPGYDFLYLLAGFTYLASLLYIVLLRALARRTAAQAYVQFIGDLLLITGLVYYFGGVSSPFSTLYLIVISVASALLRQRAGTAVATIAYGLYSFTLLSLYFQWLPHSGYGVAEPATIWRLTYNLAIHLFGFYAVALLTSYLAANVQQAEQQLERKSEHLADLEIVYHDVIQSISSGLVTTDLDGAITSVNRVGTEILGHGERALVGTHIGDCGLLTRPHWDEVVAATVRDGKVRAETECELAHGAAYVGYSLTRLSEASGTPRGYILIFQDLSEWRLLQEELRVKDRMAAVGELAAGIAHEIGNPLAAISGSVQMLSGSFAAESPKSKLLDIILKESQRLDRTIKSFLKFARPKERSSVCFDVARLLAENVELLRNSQEVSPRHRIELELDPPAVNLIADPDQISQIFWNLARNALRAMPDGGLLKVRGRQQGASYMVEVADTGRGMSERERTNLFHPFHSLFDGGTGIGMAIVYRIVQGYGGRLEVQSRAGQGTRITVELPTLAPANAPATLQAARA